MKKYVEGQKRKGNLTSSFSVTEAMRNEYFFDTLN